MNEITVVTKKMLLIKFFKEYIFKNFFSRKIDWKLSLKHGTYKKPKKQNRCKKASISSRNKKLQDMLSKVHESRNEDTNSSNKYKAGLS